MRTAHEPGASRYVSPMPDNVGGDGAGSRRSMYAWYVVAILTLANVSAFVDQQIFTLLVRPIERDFGIGDVQMSYLQGIAFALFFAVLGFPIARWADRANRRNIMAGGVGLWSIFTTLQATARTYGRLFALRVGVGVGEASLQAPGVSLLADYFPPERLGRAMSIFGLGIFVGSGAAYFIGGWIVGLLSVDQWWTVPLIGAIRPWQVVFLAVGLPGILIALLFFTIREPRRTGSHAATPASFAVLGRYMSANARTYVTQGLGFSLYALNNFALANWIPTLFVRTYKWDESAAGKVQGLLTMTIGTAGVLLGGWLTDWYTRRGKIDGPLRVGMIGALGMLVANTAFPLMPNPTAAILWLAVVNVFAALPWGAAAAALAEMAPAPLRAQSAAIYFFVLSLLSRGLGPSSVAWITQYAFHDPNAIRYSLAIVNVATTSLAFLLLAAGLGAYRTTVAHRDALFATLEA